MNDMIGHNEPPSPIEEQLISEYDKLLSRQAALLAAAERAPTACDDDATESKLTDFAAQIAACIEEAKSAHKTEKEPHLRAGQAVDTFFRVLSVPLVERKKGYEALIGGYKFRKQEAAKKAAAEAERIAREEAERLAALATTEAEIDEAIAVEITANEQAAIIHARPIELSRARGEFAMSSLKTDYDFEVVDMAKVPRQFLMLNDSAVKAHIKARLKDQAPVPLDGFRFFPKHSARIRA